jgi:hypothetical protein
MSQTDIKSIQNTIPQVSSTVQIPLLSEIVLTITSILVALVGAIVAITSILAQAPVLIVLLRTGVSILVVGLLGYFINWTFGKYLIHSTVEQFMEVIEKKEADEMDTQA